MDPNHPKIIAAFEMPSWFKEHNVNAVNDILGFMEMDFRVNTLCEQEELALGEAMRGYMTIEEAEYFGQYRYFMSKAAWMKLRAYNADARQHRQLLSDFDHDLIYSVIGPPDPPPDTGRKIPIKNI